MDQKRIQLQEILETILGSKNVYFQPPESLKMKYPAIRYTRSSIESTYADDIPYRNHKQYELIAIYKDPDSDLPDKIKSLPMCRHNRHYTADNLNHDVFTIYY